MRMLDRNIAFSSSTMNTRQILLHHVVDLARHLNPNSSCPWVLILFLVTQTSLVTTCFKNLNTLVQGSTKLPPPSSIPLVPFLDEPAF